MTEVQVTVPLNSIDQRDRHKHAGPICEVCGAEGPVKGVMMCRACEANRQPASAENSAEISKLREVLNWLLHLVNGVGKSGDSPTDEEWSAAWADAEKALAATEQKQ